MAYRPAWNGGFIWDDDAHVTQPHLRSWHGLYRVWFDLGATQQYYPLLHSAFWIEHKLWGDAPLGYHLVNIFLHVVAALMVAAVLRRLEIPGAYLAAAIFALHPVQVESVAWITELKNTLSAAFYLAAAWLYICFDQGVGRHGPMKKRFYCGALALFVLGLLSKTVTATLPAALLVIFWWKRGRLSWRRDVLPLVPFFVLGAAAGLFTAWVERKLIGAEGAAFDLTWIDRCLIAGRVIWFYLGKLLWPANLIFIYPRWHIDPSVWWQYVFLLAALMSAAALWALRRRWRGPLAGALYFVGTLFPVLGFFNIFPFIYSFVADHFQYLAGLGVIVVASAAMAMFAERRPVPFRYAGYFACLALLAVLACLTWRQCRMYGDLESLYRTTLEKNPECWMAHMNLGTVLGKKGLPDDELEQYKQTLLLHPDYPEAINNIGVVLEKKGQTQDAIEHYKRAIAMKPEYAEAYNNLGIVRVRLGQMQEAIDSFERALKANPDYIEALNNLGSALTRIGRPQEAIERFRHILDLRPDLPDVHNNFAIALVQTGKFQEALEHCEEAVRLRPDSAELLITKGNALDAAGEHEKAIQAFEKSLKIKPDFVQTYFNLCNTLVKMGRVPEAIDRYHEALRIKPDSVEAHYNLGNILKAVGQTQQAIEQYEKALQIDPDFHPAHVNLAGVLIQTGHPQEAIEHCQRALRLKPDYPEAYNFLGNASLETKRPEEAIEYFRQALRLKPDYPEAFNNLGVTLLQTGQAEEAISQFRDALRLRPEYFSAHYNLAVAYASAGQSSESLAAAQQGLDLARSKGQTLQAEKFQKWLDSQRAEAQKNPDAQSPP